MPQIPCWIAVWSLWALQKWLNWNLIFFHLSHYGQIESPAAVLWRGPQSRPFFRLQFDSFWKMSHFVVVMHCQALEPYMLWHRHQLWSSADLRFSLGHHPWHNLSPGVSVTLWSWRAWCVAVVWTPSHPTRDTAAGESKWMLPWCTVEQDMTTASSLDNLACL